MANPVTGHQQAGVAPPAEDLVEHDRPGHDHIGAIRLEPRQQAALGQPYRGETAAQRGQVLRANPDAHGDLGRSLSTPEGGCAQVLSGRETAQGPRGAANTDQGFAPSRSRDQFHHGIPHRLAQGIEILDSRWIVDEESLGRAQGSEGNAGDPRGLPAPNRGNLKTATADIHHGGVGELE